MIDFFGQYPVPLNLSEIGGFDIFGLPEVATDIRGGGYFEIKTTVTIKDIMDYVDKQKIPHHDYNLRPALHNVVADMKSKKMREDVESLRLLIMESFSKQIESLKNPRRFFFVGNKKVVQFVCVPVSFYDWTPGDTSISYSVFTERYLGVLE